MDELRPQPLPPARAVSFLDTHGHPAEIVWNPLAFGAPLAVWVFAFHGGKLVLPRHRTGGLQWIVGTLAAGEGPEGGAKRASREQAGVTVGELTPIGQFRGVRPDGGPRRSTIFVGVATRLDPVPVESGMSGVELVDVADLSVLRDAGRFMRDPSYAIVCTYLVARDLVPTE